LKNEYKGKLIHMTFKLSIALFLLFTSFTASIEDQFHFVVAADGSGDFTSVQAAIMAVPDFREKETLIFIKNGIYKEKIILPESKLKVTLIGEDPFKTILTYDDFANKPNRFGEAYGTTGSSSFFLFGHDFTARNITFENSAGPQGQAVAIRISGDRAIFENCRFLGFQDTLYAHGENSRQYYKNCYIEGGTDFIFGWSTAFFDSCEIFSKNGGQYITAASTIEGAKYGFVFYNCRLTGDAPEGKVYLGRPWRIHAQTVWINTEMGAHIRPEGWHNWNKPEAEATSFYAESGSYGPGANEVARVKWAKNLSREMADTYTAEAVLKGNDGWSPGKILENKLWPSPHQK
jgi:pectinesterase